MASDLEPPVRAFSASSERPWAIVLGGSRGLGLACARSLAVDGYNLCLVYREPRAQLSGVASAVMQLKQQGIEVQCFNVDAVSDTGRTRVLESLQLAMGPTERVAVLVHSLAKGVLKPLSIGTAPPKQWPQGHSDAKPAQAWPGGDSPESPAGSELTVRDVQLTVEAMGTSLLSWVGDLRRRALLAQDTRVVALTSEGARRAWPGYAAVSAAKAILESLVRSLALELGPFGVRANCVQAGVTDTMGLRRVPNSEWLKRHAVARNPMGRLTTPDDVGKVVALLCRPEASWINGTVVIADGGEHLC